MYSLFLKPPCPPTQFNLSSLRKHQAELPVLHSSFLPAIYFTHGNVFYPYFTESNIETERISPKAIQPVELEDPSLQVYSLTLSFLSAQPLLIEPTASAISI